MSKKKQPEPTEPQITDMFEFEGGRDRAIAYYAKGHWDKKLFVAKLLEGWGVTAKPEDVMCLTARYIPSPGTSGWLLYPAGGGRGAYKITIVENFEDPAYKC